MKLEISKISLFTMNSIKYILFVTCLFFGTIGHAVEKSEAPLERKVIPLEFEVPETQYEKLQKLDDFNGEIELCKKEIEEWKGFRNNIESAYGLSISNNNISILTDIVSRLKIAIENCVKNPNKQEYYKEQIKLEQELIAGVEGLIPFQMRLRYDWFQMMESKEVRSEAQQFQLFNNEILNKITKDGYYSKNVISGTGIVTKIFNSPEDLDSYIILVKRVIQEDISKHLSTFIKKIDGKINDVELKIQVAKNNINKIYQEDDKKFSINSLAIWVGLPAFCITILLLYLIPELITRNNSEKKHDFSALLQLITVFLLTMTILILGLSGLLTGEVLGTLIGGISGYVLNRTVSQVKSNLPSEIK